MGWVVNAMPRPFYPRKREPVPTVQETGWALRLGLTGAEYLAPPGIDPRNVQLEAFRCTECPITYILDMVWIEIMKIRNPNLARSFQHAQTICPSWNKCRWWRPCIRTWLKAQMRCCACCARMSVTVHFPLPTARLCRWDSFRLVSHFHAIYSFVINGTPCKRAEWKQQQVFETLTFRILSKVWCTVHSVHC